MSITGEQVAEVEGVKLKGRPKAKFLTVKGWSSEYREYLSSGGPRHELSWLAPVVRLILATTGVNRPGDDAMLNQPLPVILGFHWGFFSFAGFPSQ